MSDLTRILRGKDETCGSVCRVRWASHFPLLTLCIALASQCNAQAFDASSDADLADDVIDEIIVTGSRIKRRDFNTPSPLITISEEDIALSGQPTIEETLNQMPQIIPWDGRTANNGFGAADVNLRGLGPGRTLVLLNGRRVAPSGTGNSVDLNSIPQSLIKRVEIISGGTSAVYGSDAIAGVVNFITRDEYSGFDIETGISMTEEGDADSYDVSLAYGHDFASGRGNVTVYANSIERKSLFDADREHSRIPFQDDWAGNLIEAGSPLTPEGNIWWPKVDLGNGPGNVTFNADGTPREYVHSDGQYNDSYTTYLQVPLDREAVGLMAHYDLTERFEGYVEAGFSHKELVLHYSPTYFNGFAGTNLDNPLLTPEARQLFADNYAAFCPPGFPGFACFNLGKRLPELGPRSIDYERDDLRAVAGVRGELSDNWEIDGWITYTRHSISQYFRNPASLSRFQQGLLVDPVTGECFDPTGGCVPVNVFGEGNLSSEAVVFIRYDDFENITERTHKLASLFVTGSPIDTWAGPLGVAVGAEWRSDETFWKTDEALLSGDVMAYVGGQTVDGTEEVVELYAEAVIPLASESAWAEYLGLEVGGRYSDYDYSGGVWTYKAGGEWQPMTSLRLRAMYQRSIRAPNSADLFTEPGNNVGTFVPDPCSASADPIGNGIEDKCIVQGLPADEVGIWEADWGYPVNYRWGGNLELRPEVAETWTVGAVIAPEFLSNWTFAIDYFELELTGAIGNINSIAICFDATNSGNLFCDNITRDSSGNVSDVANMSGNRGLLETTAIDTQIHYQSELPDFLAFRGHSADMSVSVYWTRMLTNREQEYATTQIVECAGYFGDPCGANGNTRPKDRVTSNIHYGSGPLGMHMNLRWIAGTDNAASFRPDFVGDPELAIPEIGDEFYVDVGLSYLFGENYSTRLGINNLLNNGPPQMADYAYAHNTDTGLYDIFGRSYHLMLSAHF